jgi:hypothetical protein
MWLIYVVDQVNWLDAGFDVGNQKVHELRLSGVKTERHSASALASQARGGQKNADSQIAEMR